MSRTTLALAVLLLAAATGAQAQVYRCKDETLYTDKPCEGAKAVDVRPNLLDAGPRGFPPPPVPQTQTVVMPNPPAVPPLTTSGSVWDGQGGREADFRNRTGGR